MGGGEAADPELFVKARHPAPWTDGRSREWEGLFLNFPF